MCACTWDCGYIIHYPHLLPTNTHQVFLLHEKQPTATHPINIKIKMTSQNNMSKMTFSKVFF